MQKLKLWTTFNNLLFQFSEKILNLMNYPHCANFDLNIMTKYFNVEYQNDDFTFGQQKYNNMYTMYTYVIEY